MEFVTAPSQNTPSADSHTLNPVIDAPSPGSGNQDAPGGEGLSWKAMLAMVALAIAAAAAVAYALIYPFFHQPPR